MVIGIILGIVFAILTLGGISLAIFYDGKKGRIFGGVGALVFAILFLCIPFSFHTVDTGEVAVVKYMGEAKETRQAGTYFDFWMTRSYERYDATVQTLEISTSAYSKDAQTMDIEMTVQYQIDTGHAVEIAKTYGTLETLSNRITSISTERAKSILSSYSATEIVEIRASISPMVEELIQDTVANNYYVTINAAVLTNIDFSDAFEETVENKMIAEQEKIQAEYEKETAIIQAERDLEVAKLQADAELYAAQQSAAAQIEIAQAEAEAIKLKSIEVARMLGFTILEEEVTDEEGNVSVEYTIDFTGKSDAEIELISEYLKYIEYLSAWNGELPDVVAGDSATIMIPVS